MVLEFILKYPSDAQVCLSPSEAHISNIALFFQIEILYEGVPLAYAMREDFSSYIFPVFNCCTIRINKQASLGEWTALFMWCS